MENSNFKCLCIEKVYKHKKELTKTSHLIDVVDY